MNIFIRSNYRFIIFGMVFFIMFALTGTVEAQLESPVIIRIIPEQAKVAVNNSVDIAVEVEDVSDLYGIDILLEFDPQAVEVVDMDPELDGVQIQLGTFLDPGFVILNLVDNNIGRLRLAMTQLAPAESKSGTGNLIVVRLLGKTETAPAAVTIISVKLAAPDGTLIDVGTIENGTVEVVQTMAEPTNTPLPAVPPGTPMPTNTPTDIPTQGAEPTQAPGEPTSTATDRFLFVPPTSTPTMTPTITATPTVTFTPSATMEPSPTSRQDIEEVQTAEGDVQTGEEEVSSHEEDESAVQNQVEEMDQEKRLSLWWLSIPGVLILGGAGWFFLKKNRQDDEEPLI